MRSPKVFCSHQSHADDDLLGGGHGGDAVVVNGTRGHHALAEGLLLAGAPRLPIGGDPGLGCRRLARRAARGLLGRTSGALPFRALGQDLGIDLGLLGTQGLELLALGAGALFLGAAGLLGAQGLELLALLVRQRRGG